MENNFKILLQMVSIHRPLGYEPNTLPLRHGADVLKNTTQYIQQPGLHKVTLIFLHTVQYHTTLHQLNHIHPKIDTFT